jgi:O-antigen/teichoic acid export membrane protein
VIINALNIIQVAQVTRDVDFKRKTKISLSATLLSGVGGVLAALMGYGVWSLVVRQMLQRALATFGFWVTSRWKPGLQFSAKSFKQMFSFGFWVLAAGIMRTVFDNIYILTIGKFFPAAQLGFYTKAKQFQRLSSQQLSGAVGQVAFPVLARFQEDKIQLRNKARKFLTHTLAFTAPLLVILMVVAEPFVLILLTEKWAPMIPFLQLLCIVGVLYPIHQVNVQLLQAQGKSNLNFRIAVIKNSLRIINIALMYRFGVIYIILGEVVCSFLALAVNTYYTKQLVNYGLADQFNDLRQILLAAVIAGASGYALSQASANIYIQFLLGGSGTVVVYTAFHYVFNRPFFIEIWNLKQSFGR